MMLEQSRRELQKMKKSKVWIRIEAKIRGDHGE